MGDGVVLHQKIIVLIERSRIFLAFGIEQGDQVFVLVLKRY